MTKAKRPIITQEIILEAAKKVAAGTMFSAEDIAECYDSWGDGYQLAKALDDMGYSVCAQDVDDLDGMGHHIDALHEKKCWEWVKENDIKPDYPVGTRLDKGIIAAVSTHSPACYQVKKYGCTQDGYHLLVKFEDAVLEKI